MYKIIRSFADKYTDRKYVVGEEVDFTEKRAKEILSVGKLIEKIEVEEVVEVVEETTLAAEETTEEVVEKKSRKRK